ncbi:MAG TPA: ABC transporter permease [Streptosporangiaceae bacterium]|nr:ABC transporter permease [Streptosporangiaceae bacterium]
MKRVIEKRTTLRPADAVAEAFTSIVARPLAATAISLAALLAVAWFVAVLGLVSTANGQVTAAFAKRLPTFVRITAPRARLPAAALPFPADVERRLDALAGVVSSGVYWRLRLSQPLIVSPGPLGSSAMGQHGARQYGHGTPVLAVTPGFLAAAGVKISQGEPFGPWDQAHAAQICLVGAPLARALGITGIAGQPVIYIDGMPCVLAGVVSSAVWQPSLRRSVMLPSSTAVALFGAPDQRAGARPAVLIHTRPGAAALVARQAPQAISPATPRRLNVRMRSGPLSLRDQVGEALDGLFVAVAWVGLAVGTLGIAGLTLFCVLQRTPEYALRRALGARRRHIAWQVLSESVILGLLGGLAGASLGVAVVVLVARASHWTPVVAPQALWPAPVVGAAAGMIAGVVPAIRAAWIRPSVGLTRFPPL